jgi:hypothetical protein
MTRTRAMNPRSDHSRLSSTSTASLTTRNYLLNCRSFTLAICLVLLGVCAQAQTADVDKNWTTVGSAGTLDEKSVGKVFFDQSKVQMGQMVGPANPGSSALVSTADSAVIRYNITAVDSLFAPRVCRLNTSLSSQDVRLRLRYLAAGPGARVVAKLIEVDLATGTERLLLTFDSTGPGLSLSDSYQVQSTSLCGRPWNFDFQSKAYYIEATLTGSSIGAFTAAGIQMIQIDNFTRPAVVDPNQCAKLAAQIDSLKESLSDAKDINERKRILQAIGQLRARLRQLGCPGN